MEIKITWRDSSDAVLNILRHAVRMGEELKNDLEPIYEADPSYYPRKYAFVGFYHSGGNWREVIPLLDLSLESLLILLQSHIITEQDEALFLTLDEAREWIQDGADTDYPDWDKVWGPVYKDGERRGRILPDRTRLMDKNEWTAEKANLYLRYKYLMGKARYAGSLSSRQSAEIEELYNRIF